ncbi:MAG: hypothetical protein EBQ54_08905 [Actinobacteria bacterium]|nr:hypothetical protein [Actinomycetota bacterium]
MVAPNLRNRSFEILAEVTVPATGVEGAIIAQGSGAGGYAVYVKDKRLHYVHNFLDLYYFSVSAEVDLPVGVHTLRVEFNRPGDSRAKLICITTTCQLVRVRYQQQCPCSSVCLV